jgi:hypothetical protein
MSNVNDDIKRIAEAYANPVVKEEYEGGPLRSFKEYAEMRTFFEETGTLPPAILGADAATDVPSPTSLEDAEDVSEDQMVQSRFEQRVKPVIELIATPAGLEQLWGLMTSHILNHPKMNDSLRRKLETRPGMKSLAAVGLQQDPADTADPAAAA